MGLPLGSVLGNPCHAHLTLTSSGQITSLKLRRSSGSEKLMSQVLGRFSSLMSRFGQQTEGEKTGERKEVGLGRCQQILKSSWTRELCCVVCSTSLGPYYIFFSTFQSLHGLFRTHSIPHTSIFSWNWMPISWERANPYYLPRHPPPEVPTTQSPRTPAPIILVFKSP